MTTSRRAMSTFFILLTIAFNGASASAQVSTLLFDDGDIGDPFRPLYLGLQDPGVQVIPGPSANGYSIANIDWVITASYGNCSGTQGPTINGQKLGSSSGLNITVKSLDTIVVTAKISYQTQSTNPPTTPASNTVSGTISIHGPSGCKLVPFDQTKSYPLTKGTYIGFQLQADGGNANGYNMQPEEKISYIVPANAPPEFNGGWGYGDKTQYLTMNTSGLISDLKTQGGTGYVPGQVILKYTQTVGGSGSQGGMGEIKRLLFSAGCSA